MDLVLTRGREGVQDPKNLSDVICTFIHSFYRSLLLSDFCTNPPLIPLSAVVVIGGPLTWAPLSQWAQRASTAQHRGCDSTVLLRHMNGADSF